jgi:hypothetical protein
LGIAALLAMSCEGTMSFDGASGGSSPQTTASQPGKTPKVDPETGRPIIPVEEVEEICVDYQDSDKASTRRLSRTEYANTIQALLGLEVDVSQLSGDEKIAAFDANVVSSVDELMSEQYLLLGESLAEQALGSPTLLPCPKEQLDEACAARFIDDFGPRALRRPLQQIERDELLGVYRQLAAEFDPATGLETVLVSILQSPSFLYRLETSSTPGPREGLVKLDDFELASRLSYFLWQAPPDETLFAAAQAGELQSEAQIAAQAQRMLEDPRARQTLINFHTQWLHIDELENVVKNTER